MSKLADKIRKVTRTTPQALGFGATTAAPEPTMVLAAIAKDASAASDLAKRGADVVIVGSSGSPAPTSNAPSLGDAFSGAWAAGKTDDEAKAYREAGYDFVVFDPNTTSATALFDQKTGYVMALPADITDNEVRTLESFQLDAIHIGALDGPLTVRRQIDLRRIYAMTRKPLMATVKAALGAAELQALRDTNVIVIAVEGGENIERLRKAIDALPPRSRRKDDDRPTPLVPRTVGAGDEGEEE